MSIRFTSKVLLVTVFPVILTAIILSSILISGRIDDFNKRIDERGQNLVSHLSPISEYGVFSNNFGYMESTLRNALSQPDIMAIYILDKDNNILISNVNPRWKHATLFNDNGNIREYIASIKRTETNIDDIDSISNIDSSTDKIGTIKLIISLSNSKIIKNQIIKNGVFLTLISTVLTILIALVFSRSVTKPITLIHDGVNSIKNGDLGYRIPITYDGEIAELANGINNMTASLELSQIKEKQRAEDALFLEKTKAQITLEAIGEGVITTDINGLVTYINPAAEFLTGSKLNNAINTHLSSIFKIKEASTNKIIDYPILDCITSDKIINHDSDYILIRKDNTEYAIRETATPLRDKQNAVIGAVLVFHDFTNIKKMSDVLSYQATHDDLTDLLNRRAFEHKINSVIDEMDDNTSHILCYIDLDQFKIVNDTCGHIAGDNLLKIVSHKINEKIRKNDLFARLGGDEFGLLLFNCDVTKANILADAIRENISQIIFTWDSHTFRIGCSIGIVSVEKSSTLTEIMMAVDTACYIAKDSGRNRVHIYDHKDDVVAQKKGEMQWFQRINHALEHDNFELYSQKIASHSKNSNLVIHEVLIRLKENEELFFPGSFIPAAERYTLMPGIDKWVISALFNKLKNTKVNYHHLVFSINLSGQTLTDKNFISFLSQQLDNNYIPAENLIFEITETAAISNFIDAVEFINNFKQRGCKFALDDFGSGMCSFQYLNELPVDYLKIDGGFIKNIINNPFNQSVVQSISQIGHSLDLEIVAEFVEDQSILDQLDTDLIDYVQGYGIEYPKPIEELLS